jgi:hypothetical protein
MCPGKISRPSAPVAWVRVRERDDAAHAAAQRREASREEPRLGVRGDRVEQHEAAELDALVDVVEPRDRVRDHLGAERTREHGHADELAAIVQAEPEPRRGEPLRVVVRRDERLRRTLVDLDDLEAARVDHLARRPVAVPTEEPALADVSGDHDRPRELRLFLRASFTALIAISSA